MIVYRKQRRRVSTAEVIRRVEASHGFERQMELGELESGVADELCPDFDDDLPVLRALREDRWRGLDLPREIDISVPEGFAYYALDPELYRIASRRLVSDLRPERVAVVGVRSIGTTLASVVQAQMRTLGVDTVSWTVRPRSHPWNRSLAVAPRLEHAWRNWDGLFAIVDEGPGMSGSSFASVCRFLTGLGIEPARIALLPGWHPEGREFVNPEAAVIWRAHRKYTAAFEELRMFEGDRDLSGGKWRPLTATWPAVQPQHERRKYLRGSQLFKFAGYGRYGAEKRARADVLDAFIPPAEALDRGFLCSRWVNGRQVTCDTAFLDFAARYLALIRREFATGEAADCETLLEMIAVNTGAGWTGAVPAGDAVRLDGRMLPHEWIETGSGWLKTDALDHFDDHFFPGPQDIAWDLAAFVFEFDLDEEAERYFLDRYGRHAGERCGPDRMRFHRSAYLAFRLGYCDMAAGALGASDDAERFRRERERYAAAIRSESWMTTRSRLSA
jgi:hypothetical protein